MTKITKLYILLVASLLPLACGYKSRSDDKSGNTGKDDKGGKAPKKAETPKEAILNLAKAVETGDRDLFLANFCADDKETGSDCFESFRAVSRFAAKFEKQYGAGATREMALPIISVKRAAEAKVEEETSIRAVVRFTTGKVTYVLKKGGYWTVDIFDTGEERLSDKDKEMIKQMPSLVKRAEQKIGKPQYQDYPHKIYYELMKDMTGRDFEKIERDMKMMKEELRRTKEELGNEF